MHARIPLSSTLDTGNNFLAITSFTVFVINRRLAFSWSIQVALNINQSLFDEDIFYINVLVFPTL